MKLHPSAVQKIIALSQLYGGTTDESRLKAFISQLDFTPYEKRTTERPETVLVLTEDFTKALNQK